MRCKTRPVVLIHSLLLAMITCLGGYATAGMGPPENAQTEIKVAEFCASQPVTQADAIEHALEDLARLGRPGLKQIVRRPKDQPACAGSCTIPRITGHLTKKPTLKAEGKDITNFIGFNTTGW